MNRPLRRVAGACAVLLVLLLINLNYLQVYKADDYRTDPRNIRVLLEEYSRQRGAIVVGNDPVAISKATKPTSHGRAGSVGDHKRLTCASCSDSPGARRTLVPIKARGIRDADGAVSLRVADCT